MIDQLSGDDSFEVFAIGMDDVSWVTVSVAFCASVYSTRHALANYWNWIWQLINLSYDAPKGASSKLYVSLLIRLV